MITTSPTVAAMRMGVAAIERRRDFDEAVMTLRRARDEAARQERARAGARWTGDEGAPTGEPPAT